MQNNKTFFCGQYQLFHILCRIFILVVHFIGFHISMFKFLFCSDGLNDDGIGWIHNSSSCWCSRLHNDSSWCSSSRIGISIWIVWIVVVWISISTVVRIVVI